MREEVGEGWLHGETGKGREEGREIISHFCSGTAAGGGAGRPHLTSTKAPGWKVSRVLVQLGEPLPNNPTPRKHLLRLIRFMAASSPPPHRYTTSVRRPSLLASVSPPFISLFPLSVFLSIARPLSVPPPVHTCLCPSVCPSVRPSPQLRRENHMRSNESQTNMVLIIEFFFQS